MKLKNILATGAVICGSILTGCVGLEQYPTDKYTDANYWQKPENVRAALYKAYSQCWNAGKYWNNNIISDDGCGLRHAQDEMNISIGTSLTTTGRYSGEWNECYKTLRTVHTIFENLDRMTVDDSFKERMVAELRYIRAFAYLRLTTWYGDVPFYTKNPTLEESKTVTRTSAEQIKAFIHSELEAVSKILPKNTDLPVSETGRYTCGAAVALNARAYLLDNDFENCAKECAKLINSGEYGSYDLAEDFHSLFNKHRGYGGEAIMTVEFAKEGGADNILRGWDVSKVFPNSLISTETPICTPTQELVDCFLKRDGTEAADDDYEGRDLRFYTTIAYNGCEIELPHSGLAKVKGKTIVDGEEKWVIGEGIYVCYTDPDDEAAASKNDPNLKDSYNKTDTRTPTGYYNLKNYDPATVSADKQSYKALMEIRFGDVLLMYAESMAETGKMTSDIWDKTVRRLRERAGFNPGFCTYRDLPAAELRAEIRRERRCELAYEGRRVFDLRRWAVLDDPSVKTEGKAFLTSRPTGAPFDNGNTIEINKAYDMKYWFAVPQEERDINPKLTQNPGW